MKQYSSYSASGILWATKLPNHWEIHKGKHLFSKLDRPVSAHDEVITCFRDGTVTLRKNRRTQGFTESLKEIGYQGIRKGDLVIHQMDAFAGAAGVSDSDGKGTPVYSVCYPKKPLEPKYYAHIVREMARNRYILSLAKGIRERSTDFRFDTFGAQLLPCPPLVEQQQIVKYLDWKTAKINKFIKAKKKFIALLKEQKKNIINEAVTKGINPDVKMKDSGIEWIGKVPVSWKILKLRCILKPISIRNRPELPLLSVTRENGVILRNINCKEENHNFIPDDLSYYKVVKKGQFAMNKMKAWQGSYGVSDYEGIVSPAYYIFNLKGVETLFFHTAIRSNYYIPFFKWASDGVRIGQWDLNQNRMKEIPFFIPPISEQKEITNHIKIKTKSIDETIKRTEQEINLMMEFSSRLISDVVTGKIDIRSVEIPDFEPIEADIDISEDESSTEELVVEDM
ncbi:TPA: restriction endonuclease subunit S [Legionella pneumophila]|nr:restriction endonuclease subunit S [Legionella pneumophila]